MLRPPPQCHASGAGIGRPLPAPQQAHHRNAAHAHHCTSLHAAFRGCSTNSSSGSRAAAAAACLAGGSSSSSDAGNNNTSSSAWQDRLYAGEEFAEAVSNVVANASQRPPSQQQQQQPEPQLPRSQRGLRGSKRGGGSTSRSSTSSSSSSGSADFVVIKKGSSGAVGAYITPTQEMQVQEELLDGSAYWDAALADYDEEDEDDEDEDEGEDEFEDDYEDGRALLFGSDDDEDEDEVEVQEVVSLLRELAAGLHEEGGEGEEEAAEGGEAAAAGRQQRGGSAVGVQWRQAYLGSEQPPLTLGPVCVKQAAGKGRGLFTTAAVSAGEVLLVGAPLALLYSEEGTTPENEELSDHLAAAVAATAAAAPSSGSSSGTRGLAPWQQHALLQLRPPGSAQQQQQLPELRPLLGPLTEADGTSSSSGEQQQQQQAVLPQQLPGPEELTKLVFANCTGEEFEDQALVLLRGATSCGHLGIWPAAALINHGCAPNCHAMLLGDRLVVRAAHDIPAATELTLSYLGPQLFAPAAVRQAELKQQWGFDCSCSRCKAEARYAGGTSGTSLAEDLQAAYERCQVLSPTLDDAVDAEDLAAVRSVQQELLQMQAGLEAGIRAAKPPANVRRWLQASAYDLYDLLSLAADQLPPPAPKAARGGRGGGGRGGRGGRGSSSRGSSVSSPPVETEALATCARIVGELTPGSSAHVELATEYMVRTEARFGVDHQEAADASRLCAAAITTRYAPISDSMLQLLMDTWAGAALL